MATKRPQLPYSADMAEANPIINPVASYTLPTFPSQVPTDYNSFGAPAPLPIGVSSSGSPYSTPGYAEWQQAKNNQAKMAPGVAAASAGMAGLAAGRQVSPTSSASDAVMQTAGVTLSGIGGGALAGASVGAAGGPIGMATGAAIGGLTALVAGGLQSFMGLKASRAQARKEQRLNAAIEAKNNALMARQRADALEQQGYNRREAAIQSRWLAIQAANSQINEMLNRNAALKQRFIQSGR